MRMMDPVELRLKARMSGRETVLPVAVMLLFGVGGERSDEVLKNRSSSSLGLFIWQGSGGSGGITFMFFGLAWVVLDLFLPLAGRKIAVCDVHRRRFGLRVFPKDTGSTQGRKSHRDGLDWLD